MFEACKLLCLFVNAFRDVHKKWPQQSFSSWVTVQHYLIGSPNVNKICQEITMMKRLFFKPFTARVNSEVVSELRDLRSDFLKG